MRIIQAGHLDIPLGRQGENLAAQVRFPIAQWITRYGDGIFRLIVQRHGDAAPYPVTITSDEKFVYWDVTSVDTAVAGLGKAELQYFVGDVLAKSTTFTTRVTASLDPPGAVPDPYKPWIEEVLEAANEAEDAAKRAEEAAERAGGVNWGDGLVYDKETKTLSVDTASAVLAGDVRPVQSAAVYVEIGNIDALLQTI